MKITDAAAQEVYKKETSLKKTSAKAQDIKPTPSDQVTPEKNVMPEDKMDISVLKAEAEKAYAHLRTIVEDLLKRQGIDVSKLESLQAEDIEVDQQARDEAQQMIEPGGPLSPEKVSDRIINFAKAISDNDKSKIDLLKKAVEDGYDQAKDLMGGELPDISQETLDLIHEKFDAWENEA